MKKPVFTLLFILLTFWINSGFAQTALPYSINFGQSQEGWTAIDKSTIPGVTWEYKARYAYIQQVYYGSVALLQDYNSECNDYYISPEFQLEKGKEYTIEFNAVAETNGNGYALSLLCGTSNSDVNSFKVKFRDLQLDDNSEYPAAQKITFYAPFNGKHHFAFRSTSPIVNNNIFLFEFRLYEGSEPGETPEEVVVEPPYSVDLTKDFKDWTAIDNNKDEKTWAPSMGLGPTLGIALSQQHDDDYVSPMVTLKKRQVYKITTNLAVDNPPSQSDIVTLRGGTDKTNMLPIKQLELKNSGENIQEHFFTPQSDGNYYFSYHNTSKSGGNTLFIHSFAIEEYTEEIPEEKEIFSTDFTETNPLQGWKTVDSNNDQVTWGIIDGYNGPAYDGSFASGGANDWLISPAINLATGQDYLIKYTISQAGAFEADTYEVKYGNSQTVVGMAVGLISETIDLGSGTVDKVVRLSCTNSGNAYIGFKLTTPNPNGIVEIEKVAVFEVSKAKPKAVENLKGESNYIKKTVTLSWVNPKFDTSNAPITGNMNINIYENGTKVKTLTNRVAGTEDTYTYTPSNFKGIVPFKVTASIADKESLPAEIILDLDDVQGRPVMLQEFPLNTTSDFEKWKIENLNGGSTWAFYDWDNYIYMPKNCSEEHNDWAITPGVQLEPGKRYVINLDVSTSMNYPGNLKVWLGNAQTNTGMTKELISLKDVCYNGYVKTVTPQFSVETAGTYYIGLQAGMATDGMNVRDVNIKYIEPATGEVSTKEVPYTQNFDEDTETPEGWKIVRNDDNFGFYVLNVKENGPVWNMKAPSAPNALIAIKGAPAGRKEFVYTPKIAFKAGKTYDISFMLQMLQDTSNKKNLLKLYKATDQSEDAIVGEALIETEENTVFNWVEKKVTIEVTQDVEYVFVFKVTCDEDNAGAVMIDNFNIAEVEVVDPIEPVTPVAVKNLKAENKGGNSIELTWNQPILDIDGETIQEGSVIKTKVFDGDVFIGETEATVSVGQNDIPMSFQYTYGDVNQFKEQKVYKCVPYMEDKEGEATTTILTLSSFTKGYLKEYAYTYDFSEDLDGWSAIDTDKDDNTWKHENAMAVTNGSDEWLISPEVTLTTGKSYFVLCEFNTDTENSVNITFTRGNDATAEAQTEVIKAYENVMVSDLAVFEVGGTFNPENEANYIGIHVENANGSTVQVKSVKIMRLFTMDEPEELPYEEGFENPLEINEATNFTNKWGRRTNSSELFNVKKMTGSAVEAHSGEYAIVANEFDLRGREEIVFTPYFTFKEGETYEVSFWLYMPGNGNSITTGNVVVAYTQEDAGIPLPIILSINEPVKEWKQFKVRYTAEYDMDHCLYFVFTATAANAGMIAIDDFKIEKVNGSGISETEANGMFYAYNSSVLYLPENIESVSVYNIQGQMIMQADNANGEIQMSGLESGIYVVKGINTEGQAVYLKINKK